LGYGGKDSKNRLPSLAGVVLSSVVFFLVLSPWLVRNYEVFGRFVFLRDGFWPSVPA